MISHKNFNSLEEALYKRFQEISNTDVKDHVIKEMKINIRHYVYDAYNYPTKYVRRYERGGLLYDGNFHSATINSDGQFYVAIENMTPAKSHPTVNVVPLIVLGQKEAKARGVGVYYNTEEAPYAQPRDFINRTKYSMSKPDISRMYKKGFGGV